jgi:hypothetical protein
MAAVPPAVPRAECLPGSNPEPSIQGRVPADVVASGQADKGFNCNMSLLGREGASGGFKVHRFVDKAGHECAYYDTTLFFPLNALNFSRDPTGVAVVDMSNPAKPVRTDTLVTPAMQTPHESLVLNPRRGLLAAVQGNAFAAPGIIDIYDVNEDCRKPALQSSLPVGTLGHESGFAPDGRTFYATSLDTGQVTAVDVDNPKLPVPLWVGPYHTHGLSVSDDGNRVYLAELGVGLVVLDTSEIQARKLNPQVPEVSRLSWPELSIPQIAFPVTIGGKPFVIEIDEYTVSQPGGVFPVQDGPVVGTARIIDMQDERAPKVISDIRLEVHQPENRAQLRGDPGTVNFAQGYAGHYCSVPQRDDPGIVACSFIASGLRVFDIRDPYKPKELAYFVAPAKASQVSPERANYAMSGPDFVPERGEVWYTDGGHGFFALRVAAGVWPFGSGRRASRCLPRRLAVSGLRVGRARLGSSFSAFSQLYRATRRTRRATLFCVQGGGRFWVGSRANKIDFVATTARGHRTRRTGPGSRVRRKRILGTRRIGGGLAVGHRMAGGRVIYGLRGKRVRFLAVVRHRDARRRRALTRRLRSLGLVSKRGGRR